MLARLRKWIKGYLDIHIAGTLVERFLNLCANREICLCNLEKTTDGYRFRMMKEDFKKLKPIAKKTKIIPKIERKYGLPFFLFHYRKRKIFFISILLFFVLIYLMSLYVWDIQIEGQYTHTEEEIMKFLNTNGVECGVSLRKIDCQEIEELLRNTYTDIGWVSAEKRGTRLLIRLKETTIPKEQLKPDSPAHIIAAKQGIIVSIITRNGIPKVEKGMAVEEGDILVSGMIPVIGDNETLINTRVVVADADIKMRTVYHYQSEFSMNYIKKIETGNQSFQFGFSILDHKFLFYNPFHKMDTYDIIEKETQLVIGTSFYLPMKLHQVEHREFIKEKAVYTEEEALAIAQKKLDLYEKKLIEKGVLIIKNNVKIVIEGNRCRASGEIITEENATTYRKISDSEWRETDKDEYNRDNNGNTSGT